MMRKSTMVIFALLMSVSFAIAQDGDWGIKFSGFVKSDHFFDTRQTVSVREGHFLLFPSPEDTLSDGTDKNARPNFNQLAIQTRLTGTISAPDAFGAKISGMIEGAFFGHSESDINGFRLRHAFMKMTWGNTSLLAGQYWHPLFVTAVFPGVISFNTGVPFQPFSRNPQLRLEHKMDMLTLVFAAASQRDFASPGGSTPLRNAVIPNLTAQVQVSPDKNLLVGGSVDFKQLRPALIGTNNSGDQVEEKGKVTGLSLQGFAKITTDRIGVEVEGILGQNLHDHLMLGGYTFGRDSEEGSDFVETDYLPMKNMAFWGEVYATQGNLQPGLFFGYTQNMGASDSAFVPLGSISRGSDIKSVLRVSPRLVYKSGKAQIAGEIEYTKAGYVDTSTEDDEGPFDEKARPNNGDNSVSNIRFLLSFILGF